MNGRHNRGRCISWIWGQILTKKGGRYILLSQSLHLILVLLMVTEDQTNPVFLTHINFAFFDALCVLTNIVTLTTIDLLPDAHCTFGYDRFEVMSVFISSLLSILGSLLVLKNIWEFPHSLPLTSRMFLYVVSSFLLHVHSVFFLPNEAFKLVHSKSELTLLQKCLRFDSTSPLSVSPSKSQPSPNPVFLLRAVSLIITLLFNGKADALTSLFLGVLTCFTMSPIIIYSSKILINSFPSSPSGTIDRLIAESSTIDGVVEIRNASFWDLSFRRSVGSLHVRLRREADPNLVTNSLSCRFKPLFDILTIQVYKDEWAGSVVPHRCDCHH